MRPFLGERRGRVAAVLGLMMAASAWWSSPVLAGVGDDWADTFASIVTAENPLADERLRLPSGLVPPPDFVVVEVDFDQTDDEETSYIQLWTPAEPDDVMTLYRTALVGLGYVWTADTAPEPDDRSQKGSFELDGTIITVDVHDVAAAVAMPDGWDSPRTGTVIVMSSYRLRPPGELADGWPVVEAFPRAKVTSTVASVGEFEDLSEGWFGAQFEIEGTRSAVARVLTAEFDVRSVEPSELGAIRWVGTIDGHLTGISIEPYSSDEVQTLTIRSCFQLETWADDHRATAEWISRFSCAVTIGDEPLPDWATVTAPPPETVEQVRGEVDDIDELAAAAFDVLGPTDDVVAAVADFVDLGDLADVVPTPFESSIIDLDVTALANEPFSTADIRFVTPAVPADVAATLDVNLAAAGYMRINPTVTGETITAAFTLPPDDVDSVPEFTYVIAPGSDGQTEVVLAFSGDDIRPGPFAFGSWFTLLADRPGATVKSEILDISPESYRWWRLYAVDDVAATLDALASDPPDGLVVESRSSDSVSLTSPDGVRYFVMAQEGDEVSASVTITPS